MNGTASPGAKLYAFLEKPSTCFFLVPSWMFFFLNFENTPFFFLEIQGCREDFFILLFSLIFWVYGSIVIPEIHVHDCRYKKIPKSKFKRTKTNIDTKNDNFLKGPVTFPNHHFGYLFFSFRGCTLPETNMAPENGWLEYDRFLLGPGLFSGANLLDSFQGGYPTPPHLDVPGS